LLGIIFAFSYSVNAQDKPVTPTPPATTEILQAPAPAAKPDDKKWYDRINLRGYMQVRDNNLIETNDKLGCEQCDKAWGGTGGISLKRARVLLSGEVYKNILFKFEADFATSINGTSQNFTQIRDAFVDVGIDEANEYRVRIGQSKVPYGFENMQSSAVRLTLDRSDAINSAFLTERDMGVFFYWAPKEIRKLYADLVSQNYKGSGDFGLVAFGVFNGQTANKPDMNKQQHIVGRVTYPWKVGSQIIETSLQGYTGKYVTFDNQLSAGVISTTADKNYTDRRAGASFVLYPKPFGIQAEYNIGEGPEFDKAAQSIRVQSLQGGYATITYRIQRKNQLIFPFARYQYYTGGRKFETDARSYGVHQFEVGAEWQLNKYLEFSAEYTVADRQYEDYTLQNNHQKGNSLRAQVQISF
jgi:hypothetical protein